MRKLLVLLLLVPILGWAQNPFDGTWKIDLTQVKASEKPEVFVLENGMYHCKTCVPPLSVKADGEQQKVSGQPYMDTVAVKVIDDHNVQQSWTKDGKPGGSTKFGISPDGKTMNIDWTNSSQPNGQTLTGKVTMTRVADGPAGAHLISGSWRPAKFSDTSEEALTIRYKSTPDGLTMSTLTGQGYTASFDGKEVAYVGDPGITTVSLKKLADNVIEETDLRDGKVITVLKITAEGNTLKYEINDKLQGTTIQFVANKAITQEAQD